jgi:hypothetical protein
MGCWHWRSKSQKLKGLETAVLFLAREGQRPGWICEVLGLTGRCLMSWIHGVNTQGVEALKSSLGANKHPFATSAEPASPGKVQAPTGSTGCSPFPAPSAGSHGRASAPILFLTAVVSLGRDLSIPAGLQRGVPLRKFRLDLGSEDA